MRRLVISRCDSLSYEFPGLDATQMYETSKLYQTEIVPATALAGLGRLLARIYWML
jgi:hypothetical protein